MRTSLIRPRRSFTLLELMVAFIIMAILTAVAVPSLANLVGNDKQGGVNASAIATADASSLLQFSGGDLATVAVYTGVGFSTTPVYSTDHSAQLFSNSYGFAYVCLVAAGATPTLASPDSPAAACGSGTTTTSTTSTSTTSTTDPYGTTPYGTCQVTTTGALSTTGDTLKAQEELKCSGMPTADSNYVSSGGALIVFVTGGHIYDLSLSSYAGACTTDYNFVGTGAFAQIQIGRASCRERV